MPNSREHGYAGDGVMHTRGVICWGAVRDGSPPADPASSGGSTRGPLGHARECYFLYFFFFGSDLTS